MKSDESVEEHGGVLCQRLGCASVGHENGQLRVNREQWESSLLDFCFS